MTTENSTGAAGKATSIKFVDALDQLASARHFVEAVHMAAADIGDREKTDALQAVAGIAMDSLRLARELVEELRSEGAAS